ncbi:hypothetical protein OFAG_02300 [Oxalobacter formigenes HOxBLS]|uniref:Uncharacterized protein n=1 Tax=Oxalobacter paraformigenes TaxID=556268 RepID=T5LPI6_9BURK|nr:hypothetical protein OFAG_02300 [Oxalobacter paraformigenes]
MSGSLNGKAFRYGTTHLSDAFFRQSEALCRDSLLSAGIGRFSGVSRDKSETGQVEIRQNVQ